MENLPCQDYVDRQCQNTLDSAVKSSTGLCNEVEVKFKIFIFVQPSLTMPLMSTGKSAETAC